MHIGIHTYIYTYTCMSQSYLCVYMYLHACAQMQYVHMLTDAVATERDTQTGHLSNTCTLQIKSIRE